MTAPVNFLGYPPHEVDPDSARVVLVPVPYDGTASYRTGARFGPAAIIEASLQLEDFDLESMSDPSELGIYTAPEVAPPTGGPEGVVAAVEKVVFRWAGPGVLVGVLGGEHTVTVGAVRAMARRFDGLSVLYLDAHADMRDEYQGSRYSHACTARRVSETCPIVQLGVRTVSAEEMAHINDTNVPQIAWPPDQGPGVASAVVASVLARLGDPVYVSIDLDVLDPSIMSAVGNPEPGGMDWYQLLGVLKAVAAERTIVGFDVTELAPEEGPVACSYTAAALVYKLIGYVVTPPGDRSTSARAGRP